MSKRVVVLTGACLSTLQFEFYNCSLQGDVEGILFGHVEERENVKANDQQADNVVRQTLLHVSHFAAIGPATPFAMQKKTDGIMVDIEEQDHELSRQRFYTPTGQVLPDVLQQAIAAPDAKDIIGFFKFRRNTKHMPYMREVAVLHSLQEYVGAHKPCLFGLFSENTHESGSILTFQYSFWTPDGNGSLAKIPVNIVSLGESSLNKQHSFVSSLPLSYMSPSHFQTLGSSSDAFVQSIEETFETKMTSLKNLAAELEETYNTLKSLEKRT